MSSNMAGGVPDPNAQGDNGPTLALQNVYLKDCSYEAPNGPRVDGNWNPQINLDLHTSANGLTPELREVVLTVTVAAKQNDVTIFLVENKQTNNNKKNKQNEQKKKQTNNNNTKRIARQQFGQLFLVSAQVLHG